ncbi:Mur ligase family protein [Adlercreutzia sp. ZJ138]|uniref:Mur ligase family protein n=1 Tax=Adlercreutzia sp. ZJ138 TaxID=2709405 RepID=UPI0013EE3D4C|nr:Mur ligase family protein [Adlercreutzia sp. ZJ138]
MSKTCDELFEGIGCTVLGDANDQVEGIAYDSKHVRAGDAFFCIVGRNDDGHTFAQEAIDAGARVLVVERVPHLADSTGVTEIVVGDTRKALGAASSTFFGHPSRDMDVIGVTGTASASKTARLIGDVMRIVGKRSGVASPEGVIIAGVCEPSLPAMPDSPLVQDLLARMRDAHVDVAALAVDSCALEFDKAWGTTFAVTVFTDLAQAGIGNHPTYESYFEATSRLFSKDYPARRVICIDHAAGAELLRRCAGAEDDVLTTGFDSAAQVHLVRADISCDNPLVVIDVRGMRFEIAYPVNDESDVYALLSAFAAVMQLGCAPRDVAAAFEVLAREAAGCTGGVATDDNGE